MAHYVYFLVLFLQILFNYIKKKKKKKNPLNKKLIIHHV